MRESNVLVGLEHHPASVSLLVAESRCVGLECRMGGRWRVQGKLQRDGLEGKQHEIIPRAPTQEARPHPTGK